MNASIRVIDGNPTLTADGRPIPPMAYITYRPEENRYGDFARAGVRLYSVNLNVSEMPINERAPVLVFQKGIFEGEEPDFSIVDQNFDQILAACPEAYMFPRVNVNLPRAWEEAHPEELCDRGFGERCRFSFASDLWAQTVEAYLTALVTYIEQSPYKDRVIGYQLAAGNTEEWLSIDPQSGFGARAKEKFAAYCRERGCAPEAAAYYRFMSETVVTRITGLAAAVKRLTGRQKLVGCFYGYTLFVGRRECHHALARLLACEDVDFLCSPPAYTELRRPGIDLYAMVPTESVCLHGKVYFSENDIRTHLSRPVHEHPNYTSPIWYGPDAPASAEQMKLAFCRAMLKGYGMWWFDMWGGWYGDEAYMSLIRRMEELCRGGMDTPDTPLAVYVDEEAVIREEGAPACIQPALRSLGLCGVPYDVYLTADHPETCGRYRACVLIEPVETPLSSAAAAAGEAAGVPTLRLQGETPTPEALQAWLIGVGITPHVDRPAVVYRGRRYISLYTPADGAYDFCDGDRHSFVDLFDGAYVEFPTHLPKGKLLLFERIPAGEA